MRFVNLSFKRTFDLLGSIVGLIILAPLLILIAIIVKSSSKGPVIFKQKRLGRDGKQFYIYKFRTMIEDAERIGDGLTVRSDKDIRITKVGKVLRMSSLDELPQLINVFLGHMSLVGPRPPVTYFPYNGLESYPEWSVMRFDMRPGITGLAQVTVRNSVSWDERMKLDVRYVKEFNIWLDIKIIIATVIRVFAGRNIYGSSPKNSRKSSNAAEVHQL